jgi:orotidine-5'-phosphate decarboxylase
MSTRDFRELVSVKWSEKKFLGVGLDPEFEKLPQHLQMIGPREGIAAFNMAIVAATKDVACAYKLNSAFYEAHGEDGWAALQATIEEIHLVAPDVPVILDAKRADIGNTNGGYVAAIFDRLGADAVTIHPYLGAEAVQPFLDRKEKGVIVLCRTSNHGAGEFQDLSVDGEMLYQRVARHVSERWNKNGNCALVVGATYPEEMKEIRAIAPELPFLIPGIGTQGGNLEASVQAGKDKNGQGMIISASRSIIFSSVGKDFAEAAERSALELHGAILKAL